MLRSLGYQAKNLIRHPIGRKRSFLGIKKTYLVVAALGAAAYFFRDKLLNEFNTLKSKI